MATAGTASGERVVTTDGGEMQAESYQVEGQWIRLSLRGGASLLLPLSRIERIVDDRPAPGLDLDRAALSRLPLRYLPGDRAPETPFGDLIFETARQHGMSPYLVAAVVEAESGFDPEAVSVKGALGLMQVMPATAKRFGVDPERLHEPRLNLRAGILYLRWLSDHFPGEPEKILAGYNAGEGAVERFGGVPPWTETREFVLRVVRLLAAAPRPLG